MNYGEGASGTPTRQAFWIVLLLTLALLSGCATRPYHRAHPQFEERLRSGLTVALLPPDVKVSQLTVLEKTEPMDGWSETARKNVQAAISKQMKGSLVLAAREFDPAMSEGAREEFEDAKLLFRAVAISVALHAYPDTSPRGAAPPPSGVAVSGVLHPDPARGTQFLKLQTKIKRFDYTLGPLSLLAEASGADTLLFVEAVDYILSGARIAREVTFTVLSIAGAAVAAGRGGLYDYEPTGGKTEMSAALVDARTGDLLWFKRHTTAGDHDLRDPASAEAFVAEVLEFFAKASPTTKSGTQKGP